MHPRVASPCHKLLNLNKSPVDVCLADPATGEYSTIYSTDGSTISAGSTAIIFGKHLYICQVFDPYILKVELEP